MKFLLFFFLMTSFFIFSQESVKQAKVVNSKQFTKESGVFKFVLTNKLSKEDLNKKASYYTNYFIAELDDVRQLLTITMKENTNANRQVIQRLFLALEINEINFNENTYSLSEFYELFLK